MKNKNDKNAVNICANPNTRIIAFKNDNKSGFSIYLIISGKQEYVMSHRHNTFLYDLMKNGISFSDLRRWEPSAGRRYNNNRKHIRNNVSSVNHIIKVIDYYIQEELI